MTIGEPRRSASRLPVRTCVGCRERAERSALLRVVAVERDGSTTDPVVVKPDPRGREGGRGAWVHPSVACVDQAERRRAFARALRAGRGVDITLVRGFVDATADVPAPSPIRGAGHTEDETESGFDADEQAMSTQQ